MSEQLLKESRMKSYESPMRNRLSGLSSYSPLGDSLYQEQCEIMKQHISRLNKSPDTKARILKNFEDLLKAIHFFDKPDIIPRPLDIERIKTLILNQSNSKDNRIEDNVEKYIEAFHKERMLRLKAEEELKLMGANLRNLTIEIDELRNRRSTLEHVDILRRELESQKLKYSELEVENEKLKSMVKILEGKKSADLEPMKVKNLEFYNSELLKKQDALKQENENLRREIQEIKRSQEKLNRNFQEQTQSTENCSYCNNGNYIKSLNEELRSTKARYHELQELYEKNVRNFQTGTCLEIETMAKSHDSSWKYIRFLEEKIEELENKCHKEDKGEFSDKLAPNHDIWHKPGHKVSSSANQFHSKNKSLDTKDDPKEKQSLNNSKTMKEKKSKGKKRKPEKEISRPQSSFKSTSYKSKTQAKSYSITPDLAEMANHYSSSSKSWQQSSKEENSQAKIFSNPFKKHENEQSPRNHLAQRETPQDVLETHLLDGSFDSQWISKDLVYSPSTNKSPEFIGKSRSRDLHKDMPNKEYKNEEVKSSQEKLKKRRSKSRESLERLNKLAEEKADGCEVCVKIHHHKWAKSPRRKEKQEGR
ncbi:unnamed protein product [Blepharisma stoltei]|uniref:Uncharacterized protein n=1 Tax=Blepharisma stoltei TaxID=1481888 RepID=A0AAU9IGW4_9CILI|nr:unnamed protein product [Blepharisma stoltei]